MTQSNKELPCRDIHAATSTPVVRLCQEKPWQTMTLRCSKATVFYESTLYYALRNLHGSIWQSLANHVLGRPPSLCNPKARISRYS